MIFSLSGRVSLLTIAVLLCFSSATPFAKPASSPSTVKSATISWAKHAQQGYSLKAWFSNALVWGDAAFDDGQPPPTCGTYGVGMEYPAGACIEHLFGGGIWVGGIQDGVRKVTEGYNGFQGLGYLIPEIKDTARDKIWHTSVGAAGEPNRKGFDDDGDGKIDEDELDGLDNDGDWIAATDDIGADGIPDSLEAGCKGGYDPIRNPDPAYDNFNPARFDSCHPKPNGSFPPMSDLNRYTEKNGKPDHGEPHVDEDYGAVSPSDYYTSATDTFRLPVLYGHRSLGIKVFQRSFAWPQDAGDGIIINEYTIVNVGRKTIDSVYVAYYADADVGPVADPYFYGHNVAAFDRETGTAYVYNPVDRGSTPFGLDWLGSSPSRGRLIYRSWKLDSNILANDSSLYGVMSGNGCTDDSCFDPDQPPTELNDARFLLGTGPFHTLAPGETIRVSMVFLSGEGNAAMFKNAARARRIEQSRYFLPPSAVAIGDSMGHVSLTWHGAMSPVDSITGYQVLWGTAPGRYTSSASVNGNSFDLGSLGTTKYYMAVRAINARGDTSALSDEITNAPSSPKGLDARGDENFVSIDWQVVPYVSGYNIYRATSKTGPRAKLNAGLLTHPFYYDTAVHGDSTYYYWVTAIGANGLEGDPSVEDYARLIPPAKPQGIVFGPAKTQIRLLWDRGIEGDLAGYNVYRSRRSLDSISMVRLNPGLLSETAFIDSTVDRDTSYAWCIEAVDTTGAVGRSWVTGSTGIYRHELIVYDMVPSDSFRIRLLGALSAYSPQIIRRPPDFGYIPVVSQLALHEAIMVVYDSLAPRNPSNPSYFGERLQGYLLGGGKLFLAGRLLSQHESPDSRNVYKRVFGIDSVSAITDQWSFAGAVGEQGYPTVALNPLYQTPLNKIEIFTGVPSDRVLYTFKAVNPDPNVDGKPIGVRSLDGNAILLSFPLNGFSSGDLHNILDTALTQLNYSAGVAAVRDGSALPLSFRLYDAYPNPFNPSTIIRFDIANASRVALTVYNMLGQEVARLADEDMSPGVYEKEWNASKISSGVYFYRLQAGTYTETRKLLLIR